MPVSLPQLTWPPEMLEYGPPEDPSILLSAPAAIGKSPHRVVAVRINPSTLAADYRPDLDESIYADCEVETMLEELTFLEDIDRSVLVPMAGVSYVIWMMPSSDARND